MTLKKFRMNVNHSKGDERYAISDDLFESMYEILQQIGVFWENTPEGNDMRTDLYTFMMNRIRLNGCYLEEYKNAQRVLDEFKELYPSVEKAYAAFFTDPGGLENPDTPLAKARQKVSNEFIALQMSLGGFKAFGAENYPSYIAGAYIEGQVPPYRSKNA